MNRITRGLPVKEMDDWAGAKETFGLSPFLQGGQFGIVENTEDEDSSVIVLGDDGTSREPPEQGFGDFRLARGDEVAFGPDVHGIWQVYPAIWSATEPPPSTPLQYGDTITVAGQQVELGSTSAASAVNELIDDARGRMARFLLIRNRETGRSRVWGSVGASC